MVKRHRFTLPVALIVAGAFASIAHAQWNTHLYGSTVQAALLDTADVQESSGIVASRTSPAIYWTHNDSGGSTQLWAMRLNAADRASGVARKMGSIQLSGASNADWEDIASGPGPALYAFDGGDNPPCDRTQKRIYRIAEPMIDPNGSPVTLAGAPDQIRFEYPDTANPALPADTNGERYDCESFFVHPLSGDMYLVTKRTDADTASARVYKLAAGSVAWNSAAVHVLQFLADISSKVPSTPTGADVDAFGRRVLVRNYGNAYEFTLPEGQPFDAIFSQTPRSLTMSSLQGEGICYAADGGDIISTSEVIFLGPQRCPIYVTPWQLANVRATHVGGTEAMIQWDTAGALSSTVNYGTTTAYGNTSSDAAVVTSHEIQLTALLSGTKYYYRVTSGSLVYPPSASAAAVSLTTLTHARPDLDRDGDVDQDDFGLLQRCMTGELVSQNNVDCQRARLDEDSDVDSGDFDVFRTCAGGADIIVDLNCGS